ncbi:MAG TPA: hypothetical protein VKB86_03900 [Pyrinomonadaceae bacterium]|nr:hypothetical protein [Pyrinomonadaceae bacterium]
MKGKAGVCLAAILFSGASLIVRAQNTPTQLADVAKALECLDRTTMEGWKREEVEPLKGPGQVGPSPDILIYNYSQRGRGATLKIMYHASDVEASAHFKDFRAHTNDFKEIQNLGDEAFSWGYDDNEVAMRKGNLNVFIEGTTDIYALLPEIEKDEVQTLSRTEQRLLAKNFARMMDKTLSNLAAACPSGRPAIY